MNYNFCVAWWVFVGVTVLSRGDEHQKFAVPNQTGYTVPYQ